MEVWACADVIGVIAKSLSAADVEILRCVSRTVRDAVDVAVDMESMRRGIRFGMPYVAGSVPAPPDTSAISVVRTHTTDSYATYPNIHDIGVGRYAYAYSAKLRGRVGYTWMVAIARRPGTGPPPGDFYLVTAGQTISHARDDHAIDVTDAVSYYIRPWRQLRQSPRGHHTRSLADDIADATVWALPILPSLPGHAWGILPAGRDLVVRSSQMIPHLLQFHTMRGPEDAMGMRSILKYGVWQNKPDAYRSQVRVGNAWYRIRLTSIGGTMQYVLRGNGLA
jgi:hypothetical protein